MKYVSNYKYYRRDNNSPWSMILKKILGLKNSCDVENLYSVLTQISEKADLSDAVSND